jgi:hypothetical protein
MKLIPCFLATMLLAASAELKIVVPKDDTVLTDPASRDDFVTLARQADSVVRVKETFRSTSEGIPVVHLDVVEQIAGEPVPDLVVAAAVWDVVAPWNLRREITTFLLLVRKREEILYVQSNGIPRIYGSGVIPVVDDVVPDEYAYRYDYLCIVRPITLGSIRNQLSHAGPVK